MLIILLYHQIATTIPYDLSKFREHLAYLVHNFNIVNVGDTLIPDTINVCLTFDDAYFDFYHYIYPLLRQYNISATLGIPVQFIHDSSVLATQKRLSVVYPQGLESTTQSLNPLCTWQEIAEMVISTLVIPASHSLQHLDLVNLGKTEALYEITQSKQMLEEILGTTINTFIYPFGKMNRSIQTMVTAYYKHAMRIGNAVNYNWDQLLYRIDANKFWLNRLEINACDLRLLKWNFWYNKLRGI